MLRWYMQSIVFFLYSFSGSKNHPIGSGSSAATKLDVKIDLFFNNV